MQETLVQFPDQGNLLEEGMATYSSIHAWWIPMDRGACPATVHGVSRVGHNWATKHSTDNSITNQFKHEQKIEQTFLQWRYASANRYMRRTLVIQFSSVAQSCAALCHPWTAAHQASLTITNSRSPPKPRSIESVMPANQNS